MLRTPNCLPMYCYFTFSAIPGCLSLHFLECIISLMHVIPYGMSGPLDPRCSSICIVYSGCTMYVSRVCCIITPETAFKWECEWSSERMWHKLLWLYAFLGFWELLEWFSLQQIWEERKRSLLGMYQCSLEGGWGHFIVMESCDKHAAEWLHTSHLVKTHYSVTWLHVTPMS